jgi:hypothetical protein
MTKSREYSFWENNPSTKLVDNQVDNLQRNIGFFLSETISFRHSHKTNLLSLLLAGVVFSGMFQFPVANYQTYVLHCGVEKVLMEPTV